MANGLNRIERFLRRKVSTTASEPVSPVESETKVPEPQFPSPSFIRVKGRMAAREEPGSRQSPTRSPSVPDLLMTSRKPYAHKRNSSSSSSVSGQKPSSARTVSFRSRQHGTFMSTLNNFEFPEPPIHIGDTSPLSLTFSTKSVVDSHHQSSPRSHSPVDRSPPPSRADTPPSSDPEDEPSPRTYYSRKLPPLPPPQRAPPTPDESPELRPIPDSKLRVSKSVDVLAKALYRSSDKFGESFDDPASKPVPHHAGLLPAPHFSPRGSVLREPDLNDFFELGDYDISESPPASPELSPVPDTSTILSSMSMSTPQKSLWAPSLLTLAPPVPGNASTAAAFEAARIANRYDFDLVYAVNIWPTNDAPSHNRMGAQPMTGRLLAAHGLQNVPSPLQISAGVHCKVLRSQGWVEYRNPEAQSSDLARGYACAFYPGDSSRSSSIDSNAPVSGVRLSERIDRGIVFAAYRRPRTGGDRLGNTLLEKDLGNLHDDAEALVEMLIDIHVTSQLRQARSIGQLSNRIDILSTANIGTA